MSFEENGSVPPEVPLAPMVNIDEVYGAPDSGNPEGQHITEDPTFRARLMNVIRSAGQDTRESPNKLRTVASGAAALGTQVLDRARVAVILVPTIAVDVLKHTHNAAEAAAVGGSLFAAWCMAIGSTLTEGLVEYPKTVETFEQSFPNFVGVIEDSLPGLYPKEEELHESDKNESSVKRIGNKTLKLAKTAPMHARRGLTAIGIGNTAYVAVASTRGFTRRGMHSLSSKTGVDGGVMVGLVIGTVGEAIIELGHSHPQVANHIQNVASNKYLWYGVAGLLMASNFISTRLSRKKEAQIEQLEEGLETEESA
jgi:hypothetical protein